MSFSEEDLSRLLRAFKYAADKHRLQARKDPDRTPYINHPIEVAETLWRVGLIRQVDVLIAGVLHDTIEDTTATENEIREYFGESVLSLVKEVSDDKSLPKVERKRLQILNAPHKSTAAKQIKLADKIHNIRDITLTPPLDWSRQRQIEYLNWAEAVVAGLRGANQALEDEFDAGITVARARLANDRNS